MMYDIKKYEYDYMGKKNCLYYIKKNDEMYMTWDIFNDRTRIRIREDGSMVKCKIIIINRNVYLNEDDVDKSLNRIALLG